MISYALYCMKLMSIIMARSIHCHFDKSINVTAVSRSFGTGSYSHEYDVHCWIRKCYELKLWNSQHLPLLPIGIHNIYLSCNAYHTHGSSNAKLPATAVMMSSLEWHSFSYRVWYLTVSVYWWPSLTARICSVTTRVVITPFEQTSVHSNQMCGTEPSTMCRWHGCITQTVL